MAAVSTERFLQRLAEGKPVSAVLLHGGDLYLRELCRAKLIETYVPEGARAWGVWRFSARPDLSRFHRDSIGAEDALDRILAQAQTLPMLAPRQVVLVEGVEAWEALEENTREAVAERLAAYLDDPAPFTVLVLEANQLDERMKIFKTLSKQALVVAVELGEKPEERAGVAARIALQMAREMGVELSADAAEELVDSLNADLVCIRTELTKLATYAACPDSIGGERRHVTRSDIEKLVISAKKYSVWQLAEMLASQERARALEFLDSLLREGEQPVKLIGAIAWMYRKLIEAQEASAHLSPWQAARMLGMRTASAEMAMRHSRKIPRAQLLEGVVALSEADSELKSGVANPRAVLEFLVARLTGARSVANRTR